MDSRPWQTALAASADATRAGHHLRLLGEDGPETATALATLDAEGRRVLVAVLAGSRALPAILRRHPAWIALFQDVDSLRHPRRPEGLTREVVAGLEPSLARGDTGVALDFLHTFRLREQLRIAARDLARLGTLPELVLELSNAADAFLEGILAVVGPPLAEKLGTPFHRDPDGTWKPTRFSVLGLGKLGGQELNYSSDVDLLFVYSEEGGTFRTPPKKRQSAGAVVTNHVFFQRLAGAFIREASGRGVHAGGVRVDLRLRPEGESGPLARSLDSYETFYTEWGQTWERMMLLKARCVAGDGNLAEAFLEMVQPFRYPRFPGIGLLREMAEVKARIEREVIQPGELERNVKLGRGGIREIEFVTQALQVLNGARNPFLQTPQTLVALGKLAGYQLLPAKDVAALSSAYPFLRDVEHRLQMEEHQQTHTLPEEPDDLRRLARLMGFAGTPPFLSALRRHATRVRSIFDRVLGGTDDATPDDSVRLPGDFQTGAPAWILFLAARRFRDPASGLRLLREFVEGPGFAHVSRRTRELGRQLLPRFLDLCPDDSPDRPTQPQRFLLSDPDRVLARVDTYIQAYGPRASLFELWHARPVVFEHILKLFDRSEFLAELAIHSPDLVDGLESGGHLRRQKSADQTLTDLRHGLADTDQHLWLRRYFQTEFVRLGLRDILGLVEPAAANEELTALAGACVRYAVEVVTRRHRLAAAPFAVIALGKFGGRELVYGSDLDLIFVCPDRTRHLPKARGMAVEVLDLLTARTDHGTVFAVDTRLRPDGEKGLLVNGLESHEAYYRTRASLWEIQALTRARAVAGDPATGARFETLCRRLTDFHSPSLPLAAYSATWKTEIARMRHRIEHERTPRGKEHLAFKTGAGGLIDAEFLAQILAMEHGWFAPNTLDSLARVRDLGILPPGEADLLMTRFQQLRRMESILRRWSFEGEAVLPDDPAAQYRVAIRCGYPDTVPFLADLHHWLTDIRRICRQVLPGPLS